MLVAPVKAKLATAAPVVGLMLATFCRATPLMVLNVPATKSFVPSGDDSTALMPPLKTGRKAVSMRPVL